MEYSKARLEIVNIANAMLAGRVDLVTGSRRICALRHDIGASEDPLFTPIIGFESQTDKFPIGKDRDKYNDSYLKELDQELETFEEEEGDGILEVCRLIIENLK